MCKITAAVVGVAAAVEATHCRFKRVLDKATGRYYYYDADTRETFWTIPEGAAGGVPPNTAGPEDPRNRRKS